MKKLLYYICIILIAIIATSPILKVTNIYGHDSRFHSACVSDISENISLSNPFPKINYKVGNGLGYATHLFYPPLPHYLCAYSHVILRNFNFDVSDSIATIYLLVTILSGIAMFHLSFSVSKNELVALLSSIIYLLMPYRMGNIIVRGAMNEVFTFLFIPMILLSLNLAIENKKFLLIFVIGYTGLILSHLVITLYTSVFVIFWCLFHLKKFFKKDILKQTFVGILIVSILVLPFLSIMISQKLGGNYLIFKENYIYGLHYVKTFFESIEEFIIPKEDYSWNVPLFINILFIISLAISLISLIITKKINSNIFYHLLLLILSFLMCLKFFPWQILPDAFYTIQFPWRMHIFISISLSILAPLWFGSFNIKLKNIISIVLILIFVISEVPYIKKLSNYTYLYYEIDYPSGFGNNKEYFSINASNNLDYFYNRPNLVLYNDLYYTNSIIFQNSEKLLFKIEFVQNETKIELPRLYYVGYKLTNSKNKNITFYENEKGFIEFIGGNDTYTLEYIGPLTYQIFVIIRYIVILIIFTYWIYNKFEKKNKPRL